jgi:hypothetical protein
MGEEIVPMKMTLCSTVSKETTLNKGKGPRLKLLGDACIRYNGLRDRTDYHQHSGPVSPQ